MRLIIFISLFIGTALSLNHDPYEPVEMTKSRIGEVEVKILVSMIEKIILLCVAVESAGAGSVQADDWIPPQCLHCDHSSAGGGQHPQHQPLPQPRTARHAESEC